MQKKLGINYERISKEQVKSKLKEAHTRRKKYKKEAKQQSLEYRNQLAQAKEEAGNKKISGVLTGTQ